MPDIWQFVTDLFSGFQQASNVINTVTSLTSSLTVLTAATIFIVRSLVVDPFGAKAPKGPRYRKFFESLVERVGKRDKRLSPPDEIGTGASCAFETEVKSAAYVAHFIGKGPHKGQFGVYLDLWGAECGQTFKALEAQKEILEKHFGKVCRNKKQTVEWERPDTNHNTYRIAAYYPGSAVITADGTKLKQVRKWAVRRLVAFEKVFDQRVPGAASASSAAPASPPATVAAS